MKNPFFTTVTLTTANTAYNLYTLLSAVDPTVVQLCQDVLIQEDNGAGAALVFIGNSGVTSTTYGVGLKATWSWSAGPLTTGTANLNDIYLVADTNTTAVHVTVIGR